MPKLHLTKVNIDKVAKPGTGTVIYVDTRIKGFGLRVTKSGAASFIVQGVVRGQGKERRVTIGTYGAWTVDDARRRADEIRHKLEDGIDPVEERKQSEAAKVTLRQVANSYFARPGMLKESTRTEMDRHVTHVFAAWQERAIASITPAECRKRYSEMATKGLRGKGPAPVQAQASMITLRTLINFARDEYVLANGKPIIEANPTAILKKELGREPNERTRQIDRRQIGAAWNALLLAQATARNDDARAGADLVMFLLLTGARRNEGAMLTWDRVNLSDDPADCWWHLPNPKNNNPIWLPLSSQTVALLRSRKPADDDHDASSYVFPTRSKLGHVRDTRAPLDQVSTAIGMERLSAHDLRRTFVTLGVKACRLDLAKLELLTNHVPQGITAKHYLETSDLKDYYPEVQAISDYIEGEAQGAAIKAAIAAGENVVELHAAR